jgi:uncharacterized membrane protein YjjP (DUF1212 family)
MYVWMNRRPENETPTIEHKDFDYLDKPKALFVGWLAHHKCLITQGGVWINMVLIFFMGGVEIQGWCERHFGYSPNVLLPVVASVIAAWVVGYVMLRSGIIRAEQTFYAKQNDVLDEINVGKK